MQVYVNEINGIADAVVSLYLSKRNIDREKEVHIRKLAKAFPDLQYNELEPKEDYDELMELLSKVKKYGTNHTTLLRFVDISCSVYSLHRGAQDDFDAHAKRLESRIVRSSTRLAKFEGGEKSDYYEGKILTANEVAEYMNITLPKVIMKDGKKYVAAPNGYVLEEEKDNQDVVRGLYMLSIPSNFIFKCNLVDFAHIVSLRDKNGHAAPELIEMIESILVQLEEMTNGFITRKLLYEVETVILPQVED
jgi:predicted transcriptional regulator